jgi:uncharacterized membrane protein YfcA
VIEVLPFVLVALVAAAAALTQRVAGMGQALVCTPIFLLVFGPHIAVPLTNGLGIVLSVVILAITLRHVEWVRALFIAIPAAIVIFPVGWVVHRVDPAWLRIGIGVALLVAVGMVVHRWRRGARPARDGVAARVVTGVAAGTAAVSAGLSGTVLTIYGARTGWNGPTFVSTLQVVGIVVNSLAVLSAPLGDVPPSAWLAVGVGAVIGLAVGIPLASRLPPVLVQRIALGIATVGAALGIVTGILDLVGRATG